MGGLFAMVGNHVFPNAHLSPETFALVAMGAVFGAASRATFSFIIFAFEITRDYNAVLPLMLVAVIADGVAMLFMPSSSIMTEKLARRRAARAPGLRGGRSHAGHGRRDDGEGCTGDPGGDQGREKWLSGLRAMIRRWRGIRRY